MTGVHYVQSERRQIEVQPSAKAEHREADAKPFAAKECSRRGESGSGRQGFRAEACDGVICARRVAALEDLRKEEMQ